MKKVLALIIIALGIWYLFSRTNTDSVVEVDRDNSSVVDDFKPDPSQATFGGIEGDFTILEQRAYGDANNDEKNDTIVLLAESGGGSGVFIYVAAYVSGPVNYKGSNAIFLGDRVSPQSVSIKEGVVTVKYLDRKEGEPFAAEPTVPSSKQFVYKKGELVER